IISGVGARYIADRVAPVTSAERYVIEHPPVHNTAIWRRIVSWAVASAVMLLLAFWLLADGVNTLYAFLGPVVLLAITVLGHFGLVAATIPPAVGAFLGDAIQPISKQWQAFLLGILSQQHFPPFAVQPDAVVASSGIATVAGLISLAAGLVIMAVGCRRLV